ncbi:MAG: hypothetical protein MK240_08760, partial [Opitutales bacterium]|nr:hypothetical protein [Opitutales bacterium]
IELLRFLEHEMEILLAVRPLEDIAGGFLVEELKMRTMIESWSWVSPGCMERVNTKEFTQRILWRPTLSAWSDMMEKRS